VISPLQGFSGVHSLLEGDEVAPSATAEEVVASGGLYTEVDSYFATPITVGKLELGLSTGALDTEAAAASDVVGES
jgi:hypothetical protein